MPQNWDCIVASTETSYNPNDNIITDNEGDKRLDDSLLVVRL